jgi:pyrroline-5-carboxylate reductase
MSALEGKRIGIIGAGAIGGAVIDRLLSGRFTKQVIACDVKDERRREIAARHGVAVTAEPADAARGDLVVIAVPPAAVTPVLAQIGGVLTPRTVVVSFAGAVPLAHLESSLPPGTPVVRVNPNSPSIIGAGFNPVAYGRHATGAARVLADAFLGALGQGPEIADDLMNLYTALTAVGPTYFLPVLDALVAAGVERGLTRASAVEAAVATAQATAEMVRRRGEAPEQLKLLTGLRPLNDGAVIQLVREAIQAALARMEDVQRGIVKGG